MKTTSAENHATKQNFTPFLMIALVIGAYFLGVNVAKTQYLEQQKNAPTGAVQGAAAPTKSITTSDIKNWAKAIGLDTNKFNSCFDAQKNKALVDTDANDGKTAGVTGTPTFYINGIALVGAQPFAAFKDAIDKEIAGTADTTTKVTVDKGHLPALGNTDAKITIVEFSDFQCPFCRQFWTQTLPQIKKDYIDTGKAVLYYRQFPLDTIHPLAVPFANASECANEQGKFWQMHDKMFTEQNKLEGA